ncbi:MAG: phage integrase SAM-like domain-containing protein [Bacteroidales bacterium]|nr:phage integrase SAM-like domain-containing protein [Bacteroidales bacterium]
MRHIPATIIKRITEVEDAIDAAFAEAERAERTPTPAELRAAVDKSLGRRRYTAETIPDLFQQYIYERSRERQWSDGTICQMAAFRNTLRKHYATIRPADIDGRFAVRFVADMTTTGIANKTVKNYLTILRTFATWLQHKGHALDASFATEQPRIKTVRRNVIYLTPEELHRLEAADFSGERRHETLDAVRDILLLSSYTGLRISDVASLRHENVSDDYIEVRTKKTGAPLRIELNRHSRAVIDRMKRNDHGGYLAHDIAKNKNASAAMREACRLAGIDSPVSQAHYQSSRRIDTTGPKWQFISTHRPPDVHLQRLIPRHTAPGRYEVDRTQRLCGHEAIHRHHRRGEGGEYATLRQSLKTVRRQKKAALNEL